MHVHWILIVSAIVLVLALTTNVYRRRQRRLRKEQRRKSEGSGYGQSRPPRSEQDLVFVIGGKGIAKGKGVWRSKAADSLLVKAAAVLCYAEYPDATIMCVGGYMRGADQPVAPVLYREVVNLARCQHCLYSKRNTNVADQLREFVALARKYAPKPRILVPYGRRKQVMELAATIPGFPADAKFITAEHVLKQHHSLLGILLYRPEPTPRPQPTPAPANEGGEAPTTEASATDKASESPDEAGKVIEGPFRRAEPS